ncbi:MAG TPA: LEA type 2 family protein [Thermoanaerobaculia bacterium]
MNRRSPLAMIHSFLVPLLLTVLARPVQIDIRPGPAETFSATLVGPSQGNRGGSFSGRVSVNGSTAEIPISGRAEAAGDRLRLPVTLRYSNVPQDWANRFRPGTFDYRLSGQIAGGAPIEWSGTARWDDVGVEGERETARRFLRLETVEVTEMSLFESQARAVVAVRNPFAFPLTIASTRYRLTSNGRVVGTGRTRGMLLRPRQESSLLLPIDVDHGELLGAAGEGILSGGSLSARLSGTLVVRLPRGDVSIPLDLSGRLSLSR